MRIAICDDEKICVDEILKHLDFFSKDSKIHFENHVFYSAESLLESDNQYDIAILDVEMKGNNGIYLGEQLRKSNPHIILMYITAHKKYIDDALNLHAARFFEKPIDSRRFYRGLNDSIKRIDNSSINFYLKDGTTIERINNKDIIFIEIHNRQTTVVALNKEYHSSNHIDFWKENLKSTCFISPHKSYIINMNCISQYKRNYVILNNKYTIPIARSKQTDFHRIFLRFMEGK